MKRILLVTVACLSLSAPALAQNKGQPGPAHQQGQAASQSSGNGAQQAHPIQPSSLDRQEVRQIQMNLNKAGFDARRVDGKWGRNTEQALQHFQQQKKLPGNGQLNQQTLAALGVNLSNQPQATGSISKPGGQQGKGPGSQSNAPQKVQPSGQGPSPGGGSSPNSGH